VKFLSNAFLTLKVAYAVSVQTVCDMMNINADLMMRAVTLDRRINPSHMTPSIGQIPVDSRCLPKDLLAFKDFVASLGLPTRFFKQIYRTAVKPE
jgi:UDP-glucose 6-dehydrogenase